MTILNRPCSNTLSPLRAVGSLWFAAVLLLLLSVAMACATVFESTHGTEKALAFFYQSWWFEALLGLLAINVGAALLVRYPFSRRQIGFAIAHGSILLTLAGAWVTQRFGIDGRVGIVEGQSVAELTIPQDVFVLEGQSSKSSIEINPPPLLGVGTVKVPGRPASKILNCFVLFLLLLSALVLFWVVLATHVKRWHDRGESGWMFLVSLIPVANIWAGIELGFFRGTTGLSKYGDDPLQRTSPQTLPSDQGQRSSETGIRTAPATSTAGGELPASFPRSLFSFNGRIGRLVFWRRIAAVAVAACLLELLYAKALPSIVHRASASTVSAESVRAEVLQFASGSIARTEMLNDNPHASLAVEVSFSETGTDEPAWVPAGQAVMVGEVQVACIEIADERELRKRASTAPAAEEDAARTVKVEYQGRAYELNVDDCIAATQPVGDTGMKLRVLRYLPHATVAGRGQISNASNKPVNPAVEAELTGPQGIEKRFAFSRFPDFQSMHGQVKNQDVKLVLMAKVDEDVHAPVEILVGPGDQMHVKFTGGQDSIVERLPVGSPIHAPWPQRKLGVSRIFKNARPHRVVSPLTHPHAEMHPAILVRLTSGRESTEMWVQKYDDQAVVFAGQSHRLRYDDKVVPLGFQVALDGFTVRNYPGTNRPRSYESRVTITDPASGGVESRVISMNHPTTHGGYTFYQSSYHQAGQRMASVLSVSRDPGQPIVFAGYGLMMVGVLIVLISRLRARAGQVAENADRDGREAV